MQPSAASATVDAVIVTRNRPDMLRSTLRSILDSSYPVRRALVFDDSTDSETVTMLAAEFPEVLHFAGPRRGIAANRNRGTRESTADYILLSDDDMLVDHLFVEAALKKAVSCDADLVFTATSDNGVVIMPNSLGFLGFSDKPYRPGQAYNTANGQCFVMSRKLAHTVQYDEMIVAYGYEEMDFNYRVRAAGFRIECVPDCVNIHLNPNTQFSFRAVQDASRLYVTYKRAAVIDKSPLRAMLFLLVAVPHHLLASAKREGVRGLSLAMTNFRLAYGMYKAFRLEQRNTSAGPSSRRTQDHCEP